MDIQDILNQALKSQNSVDALSKTIGQDSSSTSKAIELALPLIMGQLAQNSSTEEGSQALDEALSKDHDGGILDNIQDMLGGAAAQEKEVEGNKILDKIFGSKKIEAEEAVAKESGLPMDAITKLMPLITPILMGSLGKTKQGSRLGSSALSALLKTQTQKNSGGIADTLMKSFLDKNGGGNVAEDLMKSAGKSLLKKVLG